MDDSVFSPGAFTFPGRPRLTLIRDPGQLSLVRNPPPGNLHVRRHGRSVAADAGSRSKVQNGGADMLRRIRSLGTRLESKIIRWEKFQRLPARRRTGLWSGG